MERRALHADVDGLERVQALQCLGRLGGLLSWLLRGHAHLCELLCHRRHTTAGSSVGIRSLVSRGRSLVSLSGVSLGGLLLLLLLLRIGVGGLLHGGAIAIAGGRLSSGAVGSCGRRSLSCCQTSICAGSKLEGLASVCSLLLCRSLSRVGSASRLVVGFLGIALRRVALRVGHDCAAQEADDCVRRLLG